MVNDSPYICYNEAADNFVCIFIIAASCYCKNISFNFLVMRKVILKLQISLDGVVSNTEQWMTIGKDILTDAIDYYKTLDTVIIGSNFYPFLSDYWQAAENSSSSVIEKQFAKQINDINKLVPSRSSINLNWKNSHHLSFTDTPSFIKIIQNLKNQPGKNISVESGIGLWEQFLQNDLFDELLLYVHPAIAGNGLKFFDDTNLKKPLHLKSSKILDKGVVKLNYEKRSKVS